MVGSTDPRGTAPEITPADTPADPANVNPPPPAAPPSPARTWSLQREWSRAFVFMLSALILGAIVTIVGVRAVVHQLETTAHQIQLESRAAATLAAAVDDHEQLGHQILADAPVNREAFILQQREVSKLFDDTAGVLPEEDGMQSALRLGRQDWQAALTARGLWGNQVLELKGNHVAETPAFATASKGVRDKLIGIQRSALEALDRGLVDTGDLEQLLIVGRTGLLTVAVGATLYFRRRMVKDLMRPVNSLRRGVHKLQAGDYGHRISVARRDELGELATAFNGMAAALQDSHRILTHRATHDALTGLANRSALTERLAGSFASGSDLRTQHEGLLFIDIDDFKDVNDSFGHEGGDELLVQLAARLRASVRSHDMVARLGGDEFAVVVLDNDDGTPATGPVAERIYETLSEPFLIGDLPLTVSVSIGVAQRSAETADAAELLRQADSAMYAAKHGGKARYEVYNREANQLKRQVRPSLSGQATDSSS
ncbi:diguanylate cyclase [Arthrobacter sp. KBS0703]|nr:diguanylate cyclase [Arthrobacter sp. KBS0703]